MVLRLGKGTLYLLYALYHQAACRISTSFSGDFVVWRFSCAEVLLKMQRLRSFLCETDSCAVYKRNMRYRNGFGQRQGKILRIILSGDEEEPCPPSRQSSLSQPPSPDNSASSSEDDDGLAMWHVNMHNPLSGHCSLNPEGVLCTPLWGPLIREMLTRA
jgi:hypothetical protein